MEMVRGIIAVNSHFFRGMEAADWRVSEKQWKTGSMRQNRTGMLNDAVSGRTDGGKMSKPPGEERI